MEVLTVFYSLFSLIILVCFFYLCYNVSKIKKSIITDIDNYQFYKEIGDKEKAYFYLQRDFVLNYEKSNFSAEKYYDLFKKLGCGIPDFKLMQELKNEEENLNKDK